MGPKGPDFEADVMETDILDTDQASKKFG